MGDRYFGNYKSQVFSYIIWTIGCLVMVITVIPSIFHLLMKLGDGHIILYCLVALSILGQSIGYGLINPLQSVIVADQFRLPEQEAQLSSSFAIYYFFSSFGSFLGETTGTFVKS